MKVRVRAIIVDNERVLLIHRVKPGQNYWVFPGGGVEPSDPTLEAALQREGAEELGVQLGVDRLVVELNLAPAGGASQREVFFACKIVGGTLGTGTGDEWLRATADNSYELVWVKISDLASLDVRPGQLKAILVDGVVPE